MSSTKVYRLHMLVCDDSDCSAKGSQQIYESLKQMVRERNLKDTVKVSKSSCLSDCEIGPNVLVYPQGVIYNGVSQDNLAKILEAHLKGKTASGLTQRRWLVSKSRKA